MAPPPERPERADGTSVALSVSARLPARTLVAPTSPWAYCSAVTSQVDDGRLRPQRGTAKVTVGGETRLTSRDSYGDQ